MFRKTTLTFNQIVTCVCARNTAVREQCAFNAINGRHRGNVHHNISNKHNTTHLLDRGKKKSINSQCWWTFILNVPIYLGPPVPSPAAAPRAVRTSPKALLPARENQQLSRGAGAPPPSPSYACADSAEPEASASQTTEVWGPQGPSGGTVTKQ